MYLRSYLTKIRPSNIDASSNFEFGKIIRRQKFSSQGIASKRKLAVKTLAEKCNALSDIAKCVSNKEMAQKLRSCESNSVDLK